MTDAIHSHLSALIGQPGGRARLNTPALLLDLDVFERNVATMQAICDANGVHLRPHAKSHKCSRIAQAQLKAGATGVCCATINEAEAMAEAGVAGLLITAPLVTDVKISRLRDLCGRAPDTLVVIDSADNAHALSDAFEGRPALNVLVDLDLGHHRTGAVDPDAAFALARQLAQTPNLKLRGIQAYAGHFQHIADASKRAEAAAAGREKVKRLIALMREAGLDAGIVSGAGTGTHGLDGKAGVFTEIQAGSYIFMDAEYAGISYEGGAWPFDFSLFVQTSVLSANLESQVTTDAGTKSFAMNGPPPRIASGPLRGAAYSFMGDEHGRIALNPGDARPALGERIECIVSHCDPTVCLYENYVCVRGDRVADIWPIDARGRA